MVMADDDSDRGGREHPTMIDVDRGQTAMMMAVELGRSWREALTMRELMRLRRLARRRTMRMTRSARTCSHVRGNQVKGYGRLRISGLGFEGLGFAYQTQRPHFRRLHPSPHVSALNR